MSNKILILLIGVLIVLMLGMGGGLFLIWNKLSTINTQANADTSGQPSQETIPEQPLGAIYALDTFIVNLADEKRNRYLRVTMDLELVDAMDTDKLTERLPQVRDSILMILPSKRFVEIASMEGKTALRDEIITKLNSLYSKEVVSNIFFTEFVVQ